MNELKRSADHEVSVTTWEGHNGTRSCFTARLDAIPELGRASSSSPEVIDQTLRELRARQVQFVRALASLSLNFDWAVQLRYVYRQGSGSVGLVGRVTAATSASSALGAQALWKLLSAILPPPFVLGQVEFSGSADHGLWPSQPMVGVEILRVQRPAMRARRPLTLPFKASEESPLGALGGLAQVGGTGLMAVTVRQAHLSESARSELTRLSNEIRDRALAAENPSALGDASLSMPAVKGLRLGGVLPLLNASLSRADALLTQPLLELNIHVLADGEEAELLGHIWGQELVSGAIEEPSGYMVTTVGPDVCEAVLAADRMPVSEPPADSDAIGAEIERLYTPEEAAEAFRLPVSSVRRAAPFGFAARSEPFASPSTLPTDRPFVVFGKIHHLGAQTNRLMPVPLEALRHHSLLFGSTGSGKTVSAAELLRQLWADHGVPFLVIDPKPSVDSPYRKLARLDSFSQSLRIYTLGREQIAPFRLNPFALFGASTVESRKRALSRELQELLPRYSTLRSMVVRSLDRVYAEHGFLDSDGPCAPLIVPTMRQFERVLTQGIRALTDVKAEERKQWAEAVGLHLNMLTRGEVGAMLRGSDALDEVLGVPTILEIYSRGAYERSSVLLFLLDALIESARSRGSDRLVHVTLVDEINQVADQRGYVDREHDGDPHSEVLRLLEEATATLRGYGEGFVIAGQTPGALSDALISNTNLKVMHQLAAGAEATSLAEAMGLGPAEIERVLGLDRGEAIVSLQWSGGPFLAHVKLRDPDPAVTAMPRLTDDEVRDRWQASQSVSTPAATDTNLETPAVSAERCHGCPASVSPGRCMSRVAESLFEQADRLYCQTILWELVTSGVPAGSRSWQLQVTRIREQIRWSRPEMGVQDVGRATVCFCHSNIAQWVSDLAGAVPGRQRQQKDVRMEARLRAAMAALAAMAAGADDAAADPSFEPAAQDPIGQPQPEI